MDIKKFVVNYLNTGVNNSHDPIASQQIFVSNLFSFIGYFTTFNMGAGAIMRSDWLLSLVLFLACSFFITSHLVLRTTRLVNPYKISTTFTSASMMLLMVYLIFTGGAANTGPLWIFVVPPVVLFFGGLAKGTRNLALFFVIISGLLFYPDDKLLNTTYSFEFKSRLLYSFFTVSCLFAFYEYARQTSFRRMREMSDNFENQAMHDLLSGLLNRRGMWEELKNEFDRSQRYQNELTLMMCDIDHFKKINDQFGHDKGDDIIKEFGNLFKSGLRKPDSIARWGGEEYLFLLPETNGKQALKLAEKLREKIEDTKFKHKKQQFNVTISFGIYQINQKDTIDQSISKADRNLYKAKEQGRNRCILE